MTAENTLHKIQKEVDVWIKEHGGYGPPLSLLVSVIEEVGGLSGDFNYLERFKLKKLTSKSPGKAIYIRDKRKKEQ